MPGVSAIYAKIVNVTVLQDFSALLACPAVCPVKKPYTSITQCIGPALVDNTAAGYAINIRRKD